MPFKERFSRAKERLLNDESICRKNRELFKEFFEFEEYKLKRRNRLRELDEGCYKTLYVYVMRLRNVNSWFENKVWADLTKEDLKRVYDDLEDGRIKNRRGEPYDDRRSYYNKIFKSKPFRLAGKDDLAREVIEFYSETPKEVRFVDESNFRKLVSVVANPKHLYLLWLAWDIGENINTLLQLKRRDFTRQVSGENREPEYLVNLPREKLKRTRTPRSEPTLYPETVKYADIALNDLHEDEIVFKFGYRQALKIIKSAIRKSGARCLPNNDSISWKDLRSGMACHLLKHGWTTDEVNFRLGHKPSSKEIDVYVSHLAIDRQKPKKRLFDATLERIQMELQDTKSRERLLTDRMTKRDEENEILRSGLDQTRNELRDLRTLVIKIATAPRKS